MSEAQFTTSTSSIVDQMQENMVAYFRLFADLPGVKLVDTAEVTWCASANLGNQVLRTHIADEQAEARIDAVIDDIARHTNQMDWLVFPACRPADLGKRLETRGMPGSPGGIWMQADLSHIVGIRDQGSGVSEQGSANQAWSIAQYEEAGMLRHNEQFQIEFVRDEAMLEEWKHISAAGFGSDTQLYRDAYARHGFGAEAFSLHYIGYLNDKAVTSSTLLLAGGIAGLWDISTPPAFRRRSFAGAITAAMMQDAYKRGFHKAWVWSSKMGQSVYARAGFVAADFGVREYAWRKR